jgi:hypothetical protein
MVSTCGEQADTNPALVRSAFRPDAEIERGRIDRQIADRGVRNFAFDLSAFELNDLAARAEDDLVEFFA